MGDSGGYRRLPGGSDDFSLQTLHHNIYISMMVVSLHNVGGSLFSDQFPLWRALLSDHPSLFFVFPFDLNNIFILRFI